MWCLALRKSVSLVWVVWTCQLITTNHHRCQSWVPSQRWNWHFAIRLMNFISLLQPVKNIRKAIPSGLLLCNNNKQICLSGEISLFFMYSHSLLVNNKVVNLCSSNWGIFIEPSYTPSHWQLPIIVGYI